MANLPSIGRAAACLGVLALSAAAAGALETASAGQPGFELPRERRQRRVIKDLLGRDRWRRLNAARFDIQRHDLGFTPKLSDHRTRQEEVARILSKSASRVVQKSVQRRLRLEERRDAFRARLRGEEPGEFGSRGAGRTKLGVSPQVHINSRPWIGAKFGLSGSESVFWSQTSLRLGSELDGADPSLKIAFTDHSRTAYVAYHTDHKRRGRTVDFLVGFSF